MEYKIKNENRVLYIIGTVLFLLAFCSLFAEASTHSPFFFYCMIVLFAFALLSLILAILCNVCRTKLTVSEDSVTIKNLFGKKTILLKDILAVNIDTIKRYRRKPEIHYEYKKKMTINVRSGKRIVLYDDASEINGLTGFVTGDRDEMPDYRVPLCQAYERIMDLLKK